MNVKKVLATAVTGCALALGGGAALAGPCINITSIALWEATPTCEQGDKQFTLTSNTLPDGTVVVFFGGGIFGFNLSNFDNSTAAGSWTINYTVTVTDPNFTISGMAAGADHPQIDPGTSNLTKDVTGDATFTLTVIDGIENAGSVKTGLAATTLNVAESISVGANTTLASVSNIYAQKENQVPEPATLLLLATGLVGLGWVTRRRNRA